MGTMIVPRYTVAKCIVTGNIVVPGKRVRFSVPLKKIRQALAHTAGRDRTLAGQRQMQYCLLFVDLNLK